MNGIKSKMFALVREARPKLIPTKDNLLKEGFNRRKRDKVIKKQDRVSMRRVPS
jgi:hypothetical protein